MSIIYILLCEQNKYYVGKTEHNNGDIIREHFTDNYSHWTKKYKPITVINIIQSNDIMDENHYTKKYMSIHGIENVRGGSYCEMILPEHKLLCLRNELRTMHILCFRCMRRGHFSNQCEENMVSYGYSSSSSSDSSSSSNNSSSSLSDSSSSSNDSDFSIIDKMYYTNKNNIIKQKNTSCVKCGKNERTTVDVINTISNIAKAAVSWLQKFI